MEKRALLAFGLILLVWVFTTTPYYQNLFFGPSDATPPSESTSESALPSSNFPEAEIPLKDEPVVDILAPVIPATSTPSSEPASSVLSEARRQPWDREEQLLTLQPDPSPPDWDSEMCCLRVRSPVL